MITIRVYLKEACQKWFIGYIIVMVNALKMTYVNRGIVHARATYCCDLLKFSLPKWSNTEPSYSSHAVV